MAIQSIYHNTGLTPCDVLDARNHGKLVKFDVKPRDDGVHVMLYPKQYPEVKIQVLNYAANVWGPNFDQLNEIEDQLNEIFGDNSNPNPFRERDIQLSPGELRKINETFLGLINTVMHYYPSEIADALNEAIRSIDKWHSRVIHNRN